MSRNLPPLNAIRAFEAAARHLSFTRAAKELNVTQAAVSHQIKGLEERLKIRLFRRAGRVLLLTDEGQKLFPDVRDALDILHVAFDGLRRLHAEGVLTVTTLPSFATRWLVPKLRRFRGFHPEIDIRLHTSTDIVDMRLEGIDVGVRHGLGQWPGLIATRLMEEDVFPVCSPTILEGKIPLDKPADLARHTLLQDAGMDWRIWLEAAGVDTVDPERGPGFLDSSMALQAAIDGQGIMLGRSVLVADDLAAGRLIKPFDISFPNAYAYWVVCPKADVNRPKVRAFRSWLLDEAEATRKAGKNV